jgi:cystathionine beta-lyase/cystathionine gamma-synthase
VRVRQQCASAASIAARLEAHPRVARVHYPGLASHPGHALAARQMRLPGAMISLEVAGGLDAAVAFLKRLSIFACAESLGGVESLAEHPAIMTHASVPEPARRVLGITDGFVRLSIGLEAEADLWADIERGLAG